MNKLTILFSLLLFAFSAAHAQQFSGIYQESEAEMVYRQQTGWDAFSADHRQQTANGYRLTDVESSRVDGDERQYYGIYTRSSLQDSLGIALGWREFVRLKRLMTSAEWLMVDVHAFALNENDIQFIGVWVKQEINHKVRLVSSRKNLDDEIRKLGKRRFKLKRVHAVETQTGVTEYVALFHYSPARIYNFLEYTPDIEAFRKDMNERSQSGVRLIDFASFMEDGSRIYLGVYENGDYDSRFEIEDTKAGLDKDGEKLKKENGLSLINLNIY